jgi:ribosome biogenesis GTPase
LEALREGALDNKKYKNSLKLKKESEFYEMTERERRVKDRKFGKFIKKAKSQLPHLQGVSLKAYINRYPSSGQK